MKLFAGLSDTHKERALHMAEHIVIDGLLENGIQSETENDEEQEQFQQVQEALNQARELESPEERTKFLFKHPSTTDLILEKAYQVAINALYIEEDEIAFHLKEIDSHYADKDEEESSDAEEEKEFAKLVANVPKKDTRHLN